MGSPENSADLEESVKDVIASEEVKLTSDDSDPCTCTDKEDK